MLARLFVEKKEISVDIITMDSGQRNDVEFQEFKIYKVFKEKEGVFGLRFFYPRLFRIWRAMKASDSDVYYVRCAGYLTGVVALFCKIYNKKSIYAAGHDSDFIPGKFLISNQRDKWLHKVGIGLVTRIVVQSKQQQKLLQKYFNRSSHVIRNFTIYDSKKIAVESRQIVLWVSTIREWKRPWLFLELAKANPDKQFVMIGGPDHSNHCLFREIEARADEITNLTFKGFQPIKITESYFDQCKVFVNTSVYEGFPNTFIQAWRRGIPVLSFFDPDNVIKDNQLGQVVTSKAELCSAIDSVFTVGSKYSDKIITYFKDNHSRSILDKYITLFDLLGVNRATH